MKVLEEAEKFRKSFPSDITEPVVAHEPDGQINFEWYVNPRRLLTVSVSESGTHYWAALIDESDPRGSYKFNGNFPKILKCLHDEIFECDS